MATMPQKTTIDRALDLRDWLAGLALPTRAFNPLRRDLELILRQHEESVSSSSVLAGMDRAQFVAELYHDDGGLIRRIPSVGALAIESLREVIPANLVPESELPTIPADEGWRDFEFDVAEDAPVVATNGTAAPMAAPIADLPPPVPAKRRGRPPRVPQALATAAVVTPAPLVRSPSPPPRVPSSTPPSLAPRFVEPDESLFHQLWKQLHPQGRRAVLNYIAEQLVRL
ncbi:MAG: hypothetical protein HGA19_08750 [Oscillochloris sp.]|nr:hypothetical protein [Oscillochloris sp.]